MPEVTLDQALQIAFGHHQAGRLEQARLIYAQVLDAQPDHAHALHLLGAVTGQMGRPGAAVEQIKRAIAILPDQPEFYCNLAKFLIDLNRLEEAVAACREALRLNPNYAEAYFNLGCALLTQGDAAGAVAAQGQAIRCKPGYAEAFNNRGITRKTLGRSAEALADYQEAIRLRPEYAEAHTNIGLVMGELGRLAEAIAAHRHAARLRPEFADAHNNLGTALHAAKEPEEALAAFQRACALRPEFADAHNNAGIVLGLLGRLDEARASFGAALVIQPSFAEAHANLGNVLRDAGELDEAIACYRRALELRPDFAAVHSNLLYALHFHPDYDARALMAEHREWNRRHAEPLKQFWIPHGNDPDPERRLRIGYVSPNFGEHPVGRFLLPLLAAHDHAGFEVFCYSDVRQPDEMTARLQAARDHWRPIAGLSDEAAAALIRADGIDILIDLAMHMNGNRMLLFARKPAPVQMTYLAYCSTTGLAAMDYRLTDPYLDPAPIDRSIYAEASEVLPETYWCYEPPAELAVGELPASKTGHITFGCLNSFAKVSRETARAWAEILRALPESRLMLHAHAGSHRERFVRALAVSPERVIFVDRASTADYLKSYHSIDIGLDPFPYGGGTTTLDALWMGVPVVTLRGRTAVGRGGVSILMNAGLPEWIAERPGDYVRMAVDLSADRGRLRELRAGLRGRLMNSPLTDASRLARGVEAAMRAMWRRWGAMRAGL